VRFFAQTDQPTAARGSGSVSDHRCQLNRSTQHHPVPWLDNACAGEPSVWQYPVKTQPEKRSGWS